MDTGLKILIICIYSIECRAEDTVTQSTGDVIAFEGESVTLGCNYRTSASTPDLFWYIQYPNGLPKHMLTRSTYGNKKTVTEFMERFDAYVNKTSSSVPLTIQKMQLSDSAVYYCALRPTVVMKYSPHLQKQSKGEHALSFFSFSTKHFLAILDN
ncbi:hypothetical protein COCON_G00091500 [Conger conger]|uniref:Ig-like domain-containing protein n=1 Tax=Conger conger TaxID=82655 RepID=A0A9Q1DL25_CONCO|nr:hypothetical protein COCON_G00091500 [Conger conger]